MEMEGAEGDYEEPGAGGPRRRFIEGGEQFDALLELDEEPIPEPHNEFIRRAREEMDEQLRIEFARPRLNRYEEAVNVYEEDTAIHVNTAVGLATLMSQHVLSHPFVVLRRQCQVNNVMHQGHLTPFTLFPVIYRLNRYQGVVTLWKGLGSSLIVRSLTVGAEDLMSKITSMPREISRNTSFLEFLQHLMIKAFGLMITTPFYAVALVETVQSDIASEKPGIMNVFREGAVRALNWGPSTRARLLSVTVLVLPTVALGLSKYIFSLIAKRISAAVITAREREAHQRQGAYPRQTIIRQQEIEHSATIAGTIVADVTFFPLETMLHRLYLQGTRTLIDSLDSGQSVVAVVTNYDDLQDCYHTMMRIEGTMGFFKGFGALVLQYALQIFVIRTTRLLMTQLLLVCRTPPPPPAQVRAVERDALQRGDIML